MKRITEQRVAKTWLVLMGLISVGFMGHIFIEMPQLALHLAGVAAVTCITIWAGNTL